MRYPSQERHNAFRADVVHADGEAVLTVTGEIDLTTCELLWIAIEKALATQSRRLVIDMTNTRFMCAAGLRVLLRALDRLNGEPSALVLSSPPRMVRQILRLSGLEQQLTIEDSAQAHSRSSCQILSG